MDHPYYDGCISDLTLNTNKQNILENNKAMVEVVAGCTLVKRAVTFKEADDSVDETKVEGYVQVTFIYTLYIRVAG